jgi:hypothetical protein
MTVSFRWGAYVETDLHLTEFLHQDHTLSVYMMLQFPYSTSGPVLVSPPAPGANAGWFELGQGNFSPVSAPCAAGAGPDGTHTPRIQGPASTSSTWRDTLSTRRTGGAWAGTHRPVPHDRH